MRCPQCGGYSFDSEDRCLNCGYKISFDAKPPPWWGLSGLRKASTTERPTKDATDLRPPKLRVCPRCHERSLFYNDKESMYECLNKRCKAKSKSLEELEPKSQPRAKTMPEMAKPTQRVLPQTSGLSMATDALDTWLRSNVGRLSRWWRWHKPHKLRITRRGLSTFWGLFKKSLVSLFLIVATTIIFAAVSLIISGGVGIMSGATIATLGLVLGVWCSNSLSLRHVSFGRFFMIVVISVIFIMASTAYLDIRSFSDVRESIIGALSISAGK